MNNIASQDLFMRKFTMVCGVLICLFRTNSLCAQIDTSASKSDLIIEGNFYVGKTLDIHPFFPETDLTKTYEVNINFGTRGYRYWQQHHNFPEIGLSLSYTDFGNQDVLGFSLGAQANLSFRKQISDKLDFKFRPGGGLAWFEKPFDEITNPDNFVIGSKVTAIAYLSASLDYTLSNNLELSLGGAFWHYSNVHIRVPNIGANSTLAKLGLTYIPKGRKPSTKKFDVMPVDDKWRINAALGFGIQEIEGTALPSGGPIYPIYGGSVYASKRLTFKSQLDFGINAEYYSSFKDYIITQEVFEENEDANSWKVIAFGGHELFFGRVALVTWVGVNLYFPMRHRMIEMELLEEKFLHLHVSNILGLQYYFRDVSTSTKLNPYIGVKLKSIGGKADYLGFSTGIAF